LLETTDLRVTSVARCGFACTETFLCAFSKTLGITPTEYHNRFQTMSVGSLVVDPEQVR
jgi:transcriptional regulator GlxA family with amidase domain